MSYLPTSASPRFGSLVLHIPYGQELYGDGKQFQQETHFQPAVIRSARHDAFKGIESDGIYVNRGPHGATLTKIGSSPVVGQLSDRLSKVSVVSVDKVKESLKNVAQKLQELANQVENTPKSLFNAEEQIETLSNELSIVSSEFVGEPHYGADTDDAKLLPKAEEVNEQLQSATTDILAGINHEEFQTWLNEQRINTPADRVVAQLEAVLKDGDWKTESKQTLRGFKETHFNRIVFERKSPLFRSGSGTEEQ